MKRSGLTSVAVLVIALSGPWASTLAAPPAPAAQSNREGGVNVVVTPRNLGPGASSWEFEVTLETHTQALNQDMSRAAALIDAQGRSHAPLGWAGDPPGGHHRRGVLRFQPLGGNPEAVELRVFGIGGVDVRTYRWRLR